MNHLTIAKQLAQNADTIRSIVTGLSDEQMRWKATAKGWSMLEVINHLYDEEREDFRQRVDYVLHRPGEDPPGIDPEGWVTARGYNLRNPAESLQNFLAERRQSVAWLEGLDAPQWESAYTHPAGFVLRAGDLLSSWLAHDFLHLRQLVELHYAWVRQQNATYTVDYAGDW
jgi:hypothetical protein